MSYDKNFVYKKFLIVPEWRISYSTSYVSSVVDDLIITFRVIKRN